MRMKTKRNYQGDYATVTGFLLFPKSLPLTVHAKDPVTGEVTDDPAPSTREYEVRWLETATWVERFNGRYWHGVRWTDWAEGEQE